MPAKARATGPTRARVAPVAAGSTRGIDPFTDPNNPLSKKSVYFDFDSFVVKSEYQPVIEAHGKYLAANTGRQINVEGNTDERGGREYNLALGQKRAEAVKQRLLLMGARDGQDRDRELRQGKAARHRQHRRSVGAEPSRRYRLQVTLLVYATAAPSHVHSQRTDLKGGLGAARRPPLRQLLGRSDRDGRFVASGESK